jgi:hypothetical protein
MTQIQTRQATIHHDVASGESGSRVNRMAIWSLVLAVLTLGGIGSVLGIWLGARARSRIAETGERGRGLALAGIIVGILSLAFAVWYWTVLAKYFGGGSGGGGGTGGGSGGGY